MPVFKKKVEEIKQRKAVQVVLKHVKDNKTEYLVGVGAGMGAVITMLVMRGQHAELPSGSGTAENSVFMRPFNFFSRNCDTISNVVMVVEREGRGHPGYIVRCLETGEEWFSQRQSAIAQNVSDAIMSLHLRGKLPDVNGLHYERIGIAN